MSRALNLEDAINMITIETFKQFPKDSPKTKKVGEKALEFLSDYPLYANTSNIGYQEAILTALIYGFKLKGKNETPKKS